jgi:hypothetical protein
MGSTADARLADRVVVVVGDDAARAAAVAAEIERRGARVAVFLGDPVTEGDALAEMVAELFPT